MGAEAESKKLRGLSKGEGGTFRWDLKCREMLRGTWSHRRDGERGCPDGINSLHWGGKGEMCLTALESAGGPTGAALGCAQVRCGKLPGCALVMGLVFCLTCSRPGNSKLLRR